MNYLFFTERETGFAYKLSQQKRRETAPPPSTSFSAKSNQTVHQTVIPEKPPAQTSKSKLSPFPFPKHDGGAWSWTGLARAWMGRVLSNAPQTVPIPPPVGDGHGTLLIDLWFNFLSGNNFLSTVQPSVWEAALFGLVSCRALGGFCTEGKVSFAHCTEHCYIARCVCACVLMEVSMISFNAVYDCLLAKQSCFFAYFQLIDAFYFRTDFPRNYIR